MFPNEPHDNIRADQIEEARRLAEQEREVAVTRSRPVLRLTARGGRSGATGGAEKKKNVLKGHEAFLKALEMNHAEIEVEKCDGTLYRGRLKHTDKYTITLQVTHASRIDGTADFQPLEPRDRVIFKHDMSEFSALSPRPAPAADEGGE